MIKPTIYDVLKAKLGREPTHTELCNDVIRILREGREEREQLSSRPTRRRRRHLRPGV